MSDIAVHVTGSNVNLTVASPPVINAVVAGGGSLSVVTVGTQGPPGASGAMEIVTANNAIEEAAAFAAGAKIVMRLDLLV